MTKCMSVIIPFYNSEKHLDECIKSLLNTEGIDDTEIILVDDGSTDRSARIADDYAADYSFITVIHDVNKGPSAARNTGLRCSSGKYVFFCDSDDRVNPDHLREIIQLTVTEDTDGILWNSELIDEDGQLIDRTDVYRYVLEGLDGKEGVITGKEAIRRQLLSRGDFVPTVWIGAFLRSFLTDNGLYFEEGIIHEDELWFPKVMLDAQKVRFIPVCLYQYRIHTGSITRPEIVNWRYHIESLLFIYPALYEYYDEVLKEDPLKDLIEENLTRRFLRKIFQYDFCRYGYADRLDLNLLWKKSVRIKDKVKICFIWLRRQISRK